MEPEYHFHSDDVVIPAQNSIHVMVTAVSKCSQQSLSGPFGVDLNEVNPDKITLTNFPDVLSRTTDYGPKAYKHSNMMKLMVNRIFKFVSHLYYIYLIFN